jgi:hypothetical protein
VLFDGIKGVVGFHCKKDERLIVDVKLVSAFFGWEIPCAGGVLRNRKPSCLKDLKMGSSRDQLHAPTGAS